MTHAALAGRTPEEALAYLRSDRTYDPREATVGMMADRNPDAYVELMAWFRQHPQLGEITAQTRMVDIPALPGRIIAKFGITPTAREVDEWAQEHGEEHPRDVAQRLGLDMDGGA